MEFQKSELYKTIKKAKVEGQNISYSQGMPKQFKKLPLISYSNFINNPKFCFQNNIYSQEMSTQIDIWSRGSSINTLILKSLCDVMLKEGWQLVTAQDIERDDTIFRIMTKFRRIIE